MAPNVPYATQAEHLVALAEGPSGYTVTLIAQKECSILSKTNVAGEARDEVSLEGVRPLQESKLITDINPNHLKLLGALTRSIQMTRSISKVLDIPLYNDSPEIRKIHNDIQLCRDAVLLIANRLVSIDVPSDNTLEGEDSGS